MRTLTQEMIETEVEVILKKEREVMVLMDRHLDDIERGLTAVASALKGYFAGDLAVAQAASAMVKEIKAAANTTQDEIWEKLCKGAYLPMIRQDLLTIIKNLGKMLDAAQSCCDLFSLQRPVIPQNLRIAFRQLAEAVFDQFGPIKRSVVTYLKGDEILKNIRLQVKQLWALESEKDRLLDELTRQVFSMTLDSWQRMQLKCSLESITAVSGRAKETSDEIQTIAMKLVA